MADERFKDSYMGEWRLAGSSLPPVGGVLTVGERLVLRTPRGLQDRHDGRRVRPVDFVGQVIIGDTPDGHVTLLHCRSGDRRAKSSGIGDVETFAYAMLLGDRHWGEDSERKFDWLSFRLTGLDSWMGRRPFKLDSADDYEAVHFTRPRDVEFPVPDGQATIGRSLSFTYGATVGSLRSEEEIQIQLDRPQPFDDLYDRYVRPLRYFFDLATDEPCQASHITVANSRVLDGNGLTPMFAVRYEEEAELEHTRSLDVEMLFTLKDVEPAEIIPAWFALRTKLDSACDLLFSLRERSKYYISTRAFTAASAADGMHRRLYSDRDTPEHRARLDRIYHAVGDGPDQQWLKNKLMYSSITYPEMLYELVDEAGGAFAPYLGLNVKRWVSRITKYRNVVAHSMKGVGAKPEQEVRLTSTVELLLRIILLRHLGFTDQQCLKMIRRVPRWCHLPQMLPIEVPRVCLPSGSGGQPSPTGRKSA